MNLPSDIPLVIYVPATEATNLNDDETIMDQSLSCSHSSAEATANLTRNNAALPPPPMAELIRWTTGDGSITGNHSLSNASMPIRSPEQPTRRRSPNRRLIFPRNLPRRTQSGTRRNYGRSGLLGQQGPPKLPTRSYPSKDDMSLFK